MEPLPAFGYRREDAARLDLIHARLLRAMAAEQERLGSEGPQIIDIADGFIKFFRRSPVWSRAYLLGLTRPVKPAELDRLEAEFQRRNIPAQVEMNSYADPDLFIELGRRGYQLSEWAVCLGRTLDPAEEFSEALAGGLAVKHIDVEREFDLWNDTFSAGFANEPAAEDYADPESHRPLRNLAGLEFYLATVDGQPAGAACLAILDQVAFFLGASTRLEYRRRGVQRALIERRFMDAAAAGCRLATVFTDQGSDSQRNMERQGFQILYSQVNFRRDLPSTEKT